MDFETATRVLFSDRTKLLAYVWSMLRDEHASEDLFQDMLIVAMRQADSFEDSEHLLKWARVTLRNKALQHLRGRREKPVALAGDVLELLESHWEECNSLDAAEVTDALRHCLDSLTSNSRKLVEMRYGKGLRGTDIADATGRKVQTVYVALSRAYKTLGECINRRLEEPHNV